MSSADSRPNDRARVTVPSSLQRLEQVLDEEIAALETQDLSGIERISARKGQCLLELWTLLRHTKASVDQTALSVIRHKLDRDMHLLRCHIEAAQAIVSVLADVVAATQADGLYSRQTASRGGRG